MSKSERHTPFVVSDFAKGIAVGVVEPAALLESIHRLGNEELPGYLRSCVRDRVPACFSKNPMLWESMRRWISLRSGIDPHEIGLSGSAQLGFSASPEKFGAAFSPSNSDLDFFFVSSGLFDKIRPEAIRFCASGETLHSGQYLEQCKTVSRTLRRNFFDLKQIPSIDLFPQCSDLNNLASMVVDKLSCHGLGVRKSHFRVYQGWAAFSNQIRINFMALRSVKNRL